MIVGGARQSGEKLFLQHFLGNRAATVGMQGTTIGVVPRTRSAVGQLGFFHVPAAQLDQRVQPLVQVPATKVRPDVADLLLARAPDFLHVVEMFFDRPARGRFRAFLLTAFKHFLANARDQARAQKRGGGVAPLPLDFASGESRLTAEPADNRTPERLYEQQWVLSLLEHVLARLRDEFIREGKERQYEQLRVFITPQTAPASYAELAPALGLSEGAAATVYRKAANRGRSPCDSFPRRPSVRGWYARWPGFDPNWSHPSPSTCPEQRQEASTSG